jgi:hypothetical protein
MNTFADTERFDPITPVHKALRHCMFEALMQVGALDTTDIFAVDRCVKQVVRLVGLLPEMTATVAPLLQSLRQRDAHTRRSAATSLYRELTSLVTEQLIAQQQFETTHTALLWAQYSDADLGVLRRRQLSAMDEQELADALRPMALALSPQELASFLNDLQASVDAQTYSCLLDTVRRQLDPARWERVAREMGVSATGFTPLHSDDAVAGEPERRHQPLRRLLRSDRGRALAQ